MPDINGSTHDFAPVNGTDIHYHVAGQGQPIAMLHAGIADLRMWDAQAEAFATTHRIVRYDLRGFGRTSMPAAAFSHRDDLAFLLRHLEVSSAIVVGASFGGRVAIEFALEYPDMTDALVLVGSALGGYAFSDDLDVFEAEIEEAHEAGDYDRAAEIDARVWVDGPHRRPEQVDPSFRQKAVEMARGVYEVASFDGQPQPLDPPAIDRLREIRVPTLVIVGDQDQRDILRIADKLVIEIPGARRVIMPGVSHLPSMEQPERFNAIVREFLDRLQAPPATGVTLREIGQDNWQQVVDLELEQNQLSFVEPNAVSLAESRFHPWMLPLAIYNVDEVSSVSSCSRSAPTLVKATSGSTAS